MLQRLTARGWLVIGLTVLSFVLLVPTILSALGKPIPKGWPSDEIKLGLDLRGGIHLSLDVQTKEAVKSQLASLALGIKAQLKREGVRVKSARQTGEDLVEISLFDDSQLLKVSDLLRSDYPDLKELSRAPAGAQRISLTYQLGANKAAEIEKNAVTQAIEILRNRIDQTGTKEPLIQKSGERRIMVQLPDLEQKDIGLVRDTIGKVAKLEFYLVADGANTSGVPTKKVKNREGGDLTLEDQVLMTGDVIETVHPEPDIGSGSYQISFKLTATGAKLFEELTGENTHRRMAVVLDGVAQSAPEIQERIAGGSARITGGFGVEEARFLSIVLRAGALPAPLVFLEERTVGATLGADSIKKGVMSLGLSTLIVVVFMITYYRKAGFFAVVSVTLNLLFLLASLAFLGATLTLPGLAGLALTVGMAVDGNIVIYERIRDELRIGASARAAIEAGFDKAHWTILDSNITTLLSGIILYIFGAGPIRGFAVTLSIGILTTVFTVLVVGKMGFDTFRFQDRKGELSI